MCSREHKEMKFRGSGMIIEHLSPSHTRQTRQTTKLPKNLILRSSNQDICFPRRPLLTSQNRFIQESSMFLQLTNKYIQCCVTWHSGTCISYNKNRISLSITNVYCIHDKNSHNHFF